MNKIDTPTDIRKALLGNGYVPLPAIDKHCKLEKWSTITVDEKEIERWKRSLWTSTAIRLDGLSMLDKDVTDPAVSALIRTRWEDAFPDYFDNADIPLLERGTDVSCKVAFFFGIDESAKVPSVIQSVRFIKPGQDVKEAQFIEVLSGSGRLAGGIGLHDKEKGSMYVWPADSPLFVPRASLPVLKTKDIDDLLGIAEAAFRELGYVEVEGSMRGYYDSERVYDIEEDMLFDCNDGVRRTLEQMKKAVGGGDEMRCSGSWHDKTSGNPTRCIARITDGGLFLVTDFKTGLLHYELSAQPEPFPDLDALGPELEKLGGAMPEPSVPGCANLKAAWIRQRYAYCKSSKTPVMPLDRNEAACNVVNFRLAQLPWREETIGPRGGIRKINPVDVWLGDAKRIEVEGWALRPDMPRPVYEEDGRQWINVYEPPVHDATGGSAALLIEFLQGLTPDEREFRNQMQVIAHKYRNPMIPGPGIVMVAQDNFGTGRGAFAALLRAVFGKSYVETIQYETFVGRGSQGQYNGYEARNLIVVVDEAQQQKGKGYYESVDTGAVVRDRVSPNARWRQIIEKYQPHRSMLVFATYVMMANNYDIFDMHAKDRRVTVYANGEPQPPEFYSRVYASIDNPADVARFVDYLTAVDLTGFDPYAPAMMTRGKHTMIDASKSEIDRSLDDVIGMLRGRGEAFTMHHVLNGMEAIGGADGIDYVKGWEAIVRKRSRCATSVSASRRTSSSSSGASARRCMHGKRLRLTGWRRRHDQTCCASFSGLARSIGPSEAYW